MHKLLLLLALSSILRPSRSFSLAKMVYTSESEILLDGINRSSLTKGWHSNVDAVGRFSGSFCRHSRMNSRPIGDNVSGIGTSWQLITLNIAAYWTKEKRMVSLWCIIHRLPKKQSLEYHNVGVAINRSIYLYRKS